IKENNISNIETEIMPNLFLLPSYIDFANYSTFLDLTYGLVEEENPNYDTITTKKINHFKELLEPLKQKYDYIFIDVPPTKSYITDSAVLASDYVLIVLQTQELSLDGAIEYLNDLQKLANNFNGSFEIVGVLPVLMDGNASLDNFVLENATQIFGEENIFNTKIPNMARLKRFDNTGITEYDRHDKKVIDLYDTVSNELLERINYFEGVK
ncbi:AAA family ATPase, partial [Enterococcus faecalis]|nr:AAA family ATPase [Enterococcus faecalis]